MSEVQTPAVDVTVQNRFNVEYKNEQFSFPLPEINGEGQVTAGGVLNLLLIALASTEDQKIRKILKEAKISISDCEGKNFFPRPED